MIFSSNICSSGYGAVKVRDDPKLYNTPNETKILGPEGDTYIKLAQDCVKNRVCIDFYVALL